VADERRFIMAVDLTVILENRPGTLADVAEVVGKAGINLAGMCGFPCEGQGVLHLLVEDGAAARRALEGAGMKIAGEREVMLVDVEDRPGAYAGIARKIASAGVNVDLVYLATRTRIVMGADDLEKARAAL
jgi:hypothetical protein